MTPQANQSTKQYDFFRKRTDEIVHKTHPLVILSKDFNWNMFDKSFGKKFYPENGQPGISTRLMVGLHYIKYTYHLSDKALMEMFVENSQWQYFCGLEYYTDKAPCDCSALPLWRQRMGEDKLTLLLKETIEVAKRRGLVTFEDLKEVIVDTTIIEKAVASPASSRLYVKTLKALVRVCKKPRVKLRQIYKRKPKKNFSKKARVAQ